MKRPIQETIRVEVKFYVDAEATFVWEEYEPGVGEYVLDEVDSHDLYHAVLEKLNDGDFDYEAQA